MAMGFNFKNMCISQQWNHGTEFLVCALHTSDGLCCCVSSHITGMTDSIWNYHNQVETE